MSIFKDSSCGLESLVPMRTISPGDESVCCRPRYLLGMTAFTGHFGLLLSCRRYCWAREKQDRSRLSIASVHSSGFLELMRDLSSFGCSGQHFHTLTARSLMHFSPRFSAHPRLQHLLAVRSNAVIQHPSDLPATVQRHTDHRFQPRHLHPRLHHQHVDLVLAATRA